MYKNTFKMVEGDIFIGNDLVMVTGQEELRQNIENRLAVNVGEWFLNVNLGLDYSAIQGKTTDSEIEFAIRECCLSDDRVKEVRIVITRDRESRRADIYIVIIDRGNEVIEFGVVV